MAMSGRVMGQRVHASRAPFDLRLMVNPLKKHMPTSITCRHCPVSFSEAGMWNRYARHLKEVHR